MFWIKQLKKFIKILNSNASPSEIAWGIALGALIGLIPFKTLLALFVFFLIIILNVNMSGAFLAIAVFGLLSFPLDPLAHKLGYLLLVKLDGLTPFWIKLYNMPLMPFTRFNNTVVLGSFVIGVVSLLPVFLVFKMLIVKYRNSWRGKLTQLKFFKALGFSKIYEIYSKFSAE